MYWSLLQNHALSHFLNSAMKMRSSIQTKENSNYCLSDLIHVIGTVKTKGLIILCAVY